MAEISELKKQAFEEGRKLVKLKLYINNSSSVFVRGLDHRGITSREISDKILNGDFDK